MSDKDVTQEVQACVRRSHSNTCEDPSARALGPGVACSKSLWETPAYRQRRNNRRVRCCGCAHPPSREIDPKCVARVAARVQMKWISCRFVLCCEHSSCICVSKCKLPSGLVGEEA